MSKGRTLKIVAVGDGAVGKTCLLIAYTQTNAFLVCFDLVNRTSYENVKTVWVPEIRKECGRDIPAILVGTKLDLRDVTDSKLIVTKAEGKKLADSLKMHGYVECSAKKIINCDAVMKAAVRACTQASKPGGHTCKIL
ncbi:hypothetical protein OTU49_011842 [Cherax quadricarinatus]|uniref:Uncharacterized protein n=1 Tax=Cherax quadricarinatus TaxID=27406 RepID=A0AAW0W3J9_CHEQU